VGGKDKYCSPNLPNFSQIIFTGTCHGLWGKAVSCAGWWLATRFTAPEQVEKEAPVPLLFPGANACYHISIFFCNMNIYTVIFL